jgi:hypothetical protein
MSGDRDSPERHVLVVTGPERERLYEHFSLLFAGRGDVSVLKDRRVAERRHSAQAPGDGERRAGERRRVRPDWIVPPS